MDTNAFLQLWKKDMEHQDEFFLNLYLLKKIWTSHLIYLK